MRDRAANFFDSIRRMRLPRLLPGIISAIVVLAALLIFLCPVPKGPFSAMHGPVTALRATRTAWLLLVTIAIAARRAIGALVSFSPIPLLLCSTRMRRDDIKAANTLLDPLPLICELRC